MGAIELHEVTKSFTPGSAAVDRVSLEIAEGEFLVLVGPSGCGKSTLLRMIAGIESVTSGRIIIGGNDVTHALPRQRDVAMVFQNYALYPHMTVFENLAFALKLRKVPKPERHRRANGVMRMLRLGEFDSRKPGQLSGGQRQRVAIGRAIVREPAAFLMDEPLSNLDAKLRVAMRAELARLHDRLAVTTLYVTHDQTEAMTLGHRVAVLKDGVLQQVDTPHALFHHPANLFVAAFIGSPTINLVEARVSGDVLEFAGHRLALPDSIRPPDVEGVVVGIRPTDLELAATANPALPRLRSTVEVIEDLGAEMHVLFPVDAPRVNAEGASDALGTSPGDEQLLAEDGRSLFTARIGSVPGLAVGDEVEFAVNTARLQFFDRTTGLALRARQGTLSVAS
jgi:multiple sugar transport system ATP-binding protein